MKDLDVWYATDVNNTGDLSTLLAQLNEAQEWREQFDDEADTLYLGQRLLLSEKIRSALGYMLRLEEELFKQAAEVGVFKDGEFFDETFDDDHFAETNEVRW